MQDRWHLSSEEVEKNPLVIRSNRKKKPQYNEWSRRDADNDDIRVHVHMWTLGDSPFAHWYMNELQLTRAPAVIRPSSNMPTAQCVSWWIKMDEPNAGWMTKGNSRTNEYTHFKDISPWYNGLFHPSPYPVIHSFPPMFSLPLSVFLHIFIIDLTSCIRIPGILYSLHTHHIHAANLIDGLEPFDVPLEKLEKDTQPVTTLGVEKG